MDITDTQIRQLRSESAQAGDTEMAAICDAALEGDEGAREEVELVISYAAAMAVNATPTTPWQKLERFQEECPELFIV